MESRRKGRKNQTDEKEEKKKIKLEWSSDMVSALIYKLNSDKTDYSMTLTNYTCLIETELYDYHFLKHMQEPKVFTIANELKRYMGSSLNTDIGEYNRDDMRYYSAHIQLKPIYKRIAYNIDIKSAYPRCLLVNGLIDEKMFNKLAELNKDERLASIGMMAARKRRFTIEGGNVVNFVDEESDYAKYFYYCVNTIANLIWQCEVISGTKFVYSWVDGLYVTDLSTAEKCRKLLFEAGYPSAVSAISDFQYTHLGTRIRITFCKDGENKLFNIPVEGNRLAQIIKFIHNENNNDQIQE